MKKLGKPILITVALVPFFLMPSVALAHSAHPVYDSSSNAQGFGTFIGTAHPVNGRPYGEHGAALYEQSVCPTGYPACLSDGTFTYGYMVMYGARGLTLDQLTNLASQFYVVSGCFGGGSPRFSIVMSDGREIHVYLGTIPNFTDCPALGTWFSTGNLATDSAGTRWDDSQLSCGAFYDTYSGAATCANSLGLTISEVLIGTDGGWSVPNAGTSAGQTFLFQNIQVNEDTRFP